MTPEPANPEAAAPPARPTSGRTLVLFAALLAVALMVALPIRTWVVQQSNLADLRSDIAAAQARVTDLEQQERQWQDPAYVEAQARLRLNLVKPGESGLITLDHTELAQVEAADPPAVTWYDKVWRSTDTASGRRPATGDLD